MGKYDQYKESVFTHEEMQPMIIETDMTDIVERLRKNIVCMGHGDYDADPLCIEAADEIERLREALLEIANPANWGIDGYWIDEDSPAEIARSALGEKE